MPADDIASTSEALDMSKAISDLDPRLSTDVFWAEAIDPLTSFAPEARTEFRRGLASGSVDDLAWARLILHSITDVGLCPIVARLLELAVATSDAEFVEPLTLFLTNPKVVDRLRTRWADLPVSRRRVALDHGEQLFELLNQAGDPWAAKFAESLRVLESM